MIKISLGHIKLFGYHGIHAEERICGAEFEVNMDVLFDPEHVIREIHETIDYTVLYNIVRERMKIPAELLETLVQDISSEVKERFTQVVQINITISKINPPLVNFRGQLSVSMNNDF